MGNRHNDELFKWLLPGISVVHSVYPFARATTLGARYAAQADRTAALAIDEPPGCFANRLPALLITGQFCSQWP